MSNLLSSNDQIERFRNSLHDNLGTYRILIGIRLEELAKNLINDGSPYANDAKEISSHFKQLSTELRLLFLSIQQLEFVEGPLIRGLYHFANEIGQVSPTKILIDVNESVDENPNIANGFYLVAREAIINAIRHAKPEKILVNVKKVETQLVLEVVDDGMGFQQEIVREGYGIQFMRNIAKTMGGDFLTTSDPKNGTTVRVSVPFR